MKYPSNFILAFSLLLTACNPDSTDPGKADCQELGCEIEILTRVLVKNGLPTDTVSNYYKTDSLARMTQIFLSRLKDFPDELSGIEKLSFLSVSGKIDSIPGGISGFRNLKILMVRSDSLRGVSVRIGELQSLAWLELANCKLDHFPEGILGIAKLGKLNLAINKIRAIPEGISALKKLGDLSLQSNSLTDLPESIYQLGGLAELTLSGNKLTRISESIKALPMLWSLQLDGNLLTALPDGIGEMTGLDRINLKDNRLETLPASIIHLTPGNYFGVGGNRICEPSVEISNWLREYDPFWKSSQTCIQ